MVLTQAALAELFILKANGGRTKQTHTEMTRAGQNKI